MAIIYAGDLHGRVDDLSKIIDFAESEKITAIVQVGDFGFGFPDDGYYDFFEKRARQKKWTVPIYTCFGNHDNWDRIYTMMEQQGNPEKVEIYPDAGLYFVPRGNVLEIDGVTHLFMGGAESTDRYRRKEGKTWWAREEPNWKDFEKFHRALEEQKPDTVVAHEAPLRVELYRVRRNQSYTPKMLERVLSMSEYQPKRYRFGHHHVLEKKKKKKTKYYGCGLHGQYWLYEKEVEES